MTLGLFKPIRIVLTRPADRQRPTGCVIKAGKRVCADLRINPEGHWSGKTLPRLSGASTVRLACTLVPLQTCHEIKVLADTRSRLMTPRWRVESPTIGREFQVDWRQFYDWLPCFLMDIYEVIGART